MGVNYSEFEALKKKLEKVSQADTQRFMIKTTSEIAARVLRDVRKRTPTGHKPKVSNQILQMYWEGYQGGTLKRAWTVHPMSRSTSPQGTVYRYKVINPTRYASYVEYGHRQRPGRYVPQLGKRLKVSWVKGKFMLTKSQKSVQDKVPQIVDKRLDEFLKKVFEE